MAIELMPRVAIQPVRSQTGGAGGRVEPMRDATGAQLQQIGEGAQDLGRALTSAADRFQDEVDVTMSERLRNLYDAEVEREMTAPGQGFLTTLGMDASPERRKQHGDRLRQARERIAKLGQNDAQKLNFAEHADRVDAQTTKVANRHQVSELRTWKAGETRVAAETGIRRGIQFAGTEEGEVQVAVAMQKLDEWGRLVGYGPARIEAEKQKARDVLHSGVAENLVNNGLPAQAREYYEQNKGAMSPAFAGDVKRLTDHAVLDQVARASAEGAYAQAEMERRSEIATGGAYPLGTKPDDVDLDLADAEWISQRVYSIVDESQKLSPTEKAEATQRINFIQRRRAEVAAGRKNTVRGQSEQWLSENPLAGVTEMPPQLYVAAKRSGLIDDLAEFARSKRYVTDRPTLDALKAMPTSELAQMTDQEFEARFRSKLDNVDYPYGKALHRRATGQADDGDAEAVTWRDQLDEFSRKLNVLPRSGTATGPEKEADHRLRQEIQKRLDAKRASLPAGKKLTPEDRTKVLDEMAKDVAFTEVGFPDPSKTIVTMTKEEQESAYVQVGGENVYLRDIPPAEQAKIQASLEARGRPVNQKAIAELWVRAGRPR